MIHDSQSTKRLLRSCMQPNKKKRMKFGNIVRGGAGGKRKKRSRKTKKKPSGADPERAGELEFSRASGEGAAVKTETAFLSASTRNVNDR